MYHVKVSTNQGRSLICSVIKGIGTRVLLALTALVLLLVVCGKALSVALT